jgi:hypothetical protein
MAILVFCITTGLRTESRECSLVQEGVPQGKAHFRCGAHISGPRCVRCVGAPLYPVGNDLLDRGYDFVVLWDVLFLVVMVGRYVVFNDAQTIDFVG